MRALLQRLSAPPKQTLHTLQPTPSTALYTVATRAHPQSLVASFIHYISLQIRFIIGLSTLALLWKKWGLTFQQPTKMLDWILGPGEQWLNKLTTFAEQCEWMYLGPASLVLLYLVCKREYTEESLLVLRGLGVQTSSTSSTYLQTPTKRFIPTTSIRDIVIHEAFKGFEVRFYLAIIVEGEEDVVVVFPKMLPRRAVLEEVWRGARKCLWDGQKSSGDQADGKKNEAI